jgi:hypothetical protein
VANALALLQVAMLASVLGAWPTQAQSTAQIGIALGIKALFTQCVL